VCATLNESERYGREGVDSIRMVQDMAHWLVVVIEDGKEIYVNINVGVIS
jgi:hypothetical protein